MYIYHRQSNIVRRNNNKNNEKEDRQIPLDEKRLEKVFYV